MRFTPNILLDMKIKLFVLIAAFGVGLVSPAWSQVGVSSSGVSGVGSVITPISEPYELGPTLDVVPYVSADGYTVQMTIIPTIKEFVGYDLESGKLFQAQAQSVGTGVGNPIVQQQPLPIFRLRQVVTSAIVWDGQTVVLGGLISDNVVKTKDKVPVIGDLPLVGRLFRSESSTSKKKNLLIFVTPTIIDPAGNRMHSEEEMPFAQTAIPPQKPVTP
jgi:general secretion pathway protein D